MTEFKKWWDKVSMEGDKDYECYAKLGWEAALEWALSGEENYCSFRQCVTADRIEEELERK